MEKANGVLRRVSIEVVDNGFVIETSVYENDWSSRENKHVLNELGEVFAHLATCWGKHQEVLDKLKKDKEEVSTDE